MGISAVYENAADEIEGIEFSFGLSPALDLLEVGFVFSASPLSSPFGLSSRVKLVSAESMFSFVEKRLCKEL